jgi:translation elongation factor EF-Ts
MHVAGLKPLYLEAAAVPPEVLEAERRLLTEQAATSGKPAAVVEKMVAGRLGKWAQEVRGPAARGWRGGVVCGASRVGSGQPS